MGVANAFFGTKVILNGDLPEVESYKERYNTFETYFFSSCDHV